MPTRMTKKNKKTKKQKDKKEKNKGTKKFRGGMFSMIGLGSTRNKKYNEQPNQYALKRKDIDLKYKKSQLELEEKQLEVSKHLLEDKKKEFEEESKKQIANNPFYQKAMVEISIDKLREKINDFLKEMKSIVNRKRDREYEDLTQDVAGHHSSGTHLTHAYDEVKTMIRRLNEIPNLLSEIDEMMKSGKLSNIPEGTGPEGTGPESTGPEGTGPEGTGPESTGPEGTGPEGTGQQGTGQQGTGQQGTGHKSSLGTSF